MTIAFHLMRCLCPLPTLFLLALLLLCAFPLLPVQLLLALLRNTLLLLHLPLPVDILLTFLPPAVLFHLPLLLFLSLHLPAVRSACRGSSPRLDCGRFCGLSGPPRFS